MAPPGFRASGIVLPANEPAKGSGGEEERAAGETNRPSPGIDPPGESPADAVDSTPAKGLGQALMEAVPEGREKPVSGEEREEIPEEKEPGNGSQPRSADGAPSSSSPGLGTEAQPIETLKRGDMSAMFGGLMDRLSRAVGASGEFRPKMPAAFVPEASRKKSGPETRPVRCFECNHQQRVSVAAASTQCARCGTYISLEDFDIESTWSRNIHTRGKVRVKKKGVVTGGSIACHDLEMEGKLFAAVNCSGEAVFRGAARVMGGLHCRRLVVEKKGRVVFPQGVAAESAEIYGALEGDILCAGTVRIFKSGVVTGDVAARAVDLKDGGILSGRMSIQPDLDITPPEKKGFLQGE